MSTRAPISLQPTRPVDRYRLPRPPDALIAFWSQPILRVAGAIGIALAIAVALGIAMPRGPVDSGEALLLMAISVLGGVAAGFVMRSGWAVVAASLAFLLAYEFVRRGEQGPSVDGIHLDTAFGILGLLVGRGVFVLLGLIPMALGCAYGAWLAGLLLEQSGISRQRAHTRFRRLRYAVTGLATLVVIGLAVWVALPASVPAVKGPNGNAAVGGIAELVEVDLNGHQQWIQIRGANAENPVVLYLNGGPGQSDLAMSRVLLEPLHQNFTVVGWDQRGTGKSYGSLDPETLTLDGIVDDTIALTNYLRDRFDQEKIFLLTESWGSVPGVLAVQRHPELYHAYIGSGQMVDLLETDRIIYEDLLADAKRRGDDGLVRTLEGFGPPPYGDIWDYAFVVQHYELIEDDYDPPAAYVDRYESSGIGFWGIMGSEYTLIDKTNVIRGLLDMASVMYPQLQEIDFRQQAASLEVPVYLFLGEHELRGRQELAQEWFDMLDAPVKHLYTFANAGHAPAFEYADDLHRILLEEIIPQTALAT